MSQNMTAAELKKDTCLWGLKTFGYAALAFVLGLISYFALGMLVSIGEELTGYRYYSVPTNGGIAETLFETTYERYDDYVVDGETYRLDKSYAYDYDTHTFVYSEELTAETQKVRPTLDIEALQESVPEGVSVQAIYRPNTALEIFVEVISQLLLLVLLVVMVYEPLWRLGDKDRNKVQFGRMPEDKYRGLKAGLLASIPSGLVVLGLFVSKLTGWLPNYIFWYRLAAMPFAPINNALTGGVMWMDQVTGWLLPISVLCWTVLPLSAAIGYLFGYKGIAIGERIMYKKK